MQLDKNISLVKTLLEDGDDPEKKEGSRKYFSIYSLFKSKNTIEKNKKKDRFLKISGWAAIHWAVYLNHEQILEELLLHGDDSTAIFDLTPLQ